VACSTHGRNEKLHKIWVGKTVRKMGDNIRTNLREIGWEAVGRIYPAQDRDLWWTLMNTVMNLRFP